MEHSPEYEKLKDRWEHDRISESMLRKYVKAGRITEEEFEEITGKPY